MILQKESGNTMGGAYVQRGRLKENRKKTLLLRVKKIQVKVLEHIMRMVGLENLTLIRRIEDKRGRGKHRVIYLTSLHKWMAKQGCRRMAKNQTML